MAVVLLEWFAQLRRCALVALIIVGSVAWIAVVTLRLQQISHEIADAEDEMTRASGQTEGGRKAKARLEAKISDWVSGCVFYFDSMFRKSRVNTVFYLSRRPVNRRW